MFLEKLEIISKDGLIREINFKKGLNLIVDNTPKSDLKATGNNVGKTTVLKLIDFCLGASPKIIYTDTENKKSEYKLVKDFLISNKVVVKLTLVDDLDMTKRKKVVKIERNFLNYSKKLNKINGEQIEKADFETRLLNAVFPSVNISRPTFRQIISHNIRYKDDSINNTIKTLNRYTTDVEYECLYLFLLGCSYNDGEEKQKLLAKKKQEITFKGRLEKDNTKNAYEVSLNLVNNQINKLEVKKSNFNLNEDFEKQLEELNKVKYLINKQSSTLSKLKIRKNIIEEAEKSMVNELSTFDIEQLRILYLEANSNLGNLQKTFEDLVDYHNKMMKEKISFITKELPSIREETLRGESLLADLLKQEKDLSIKIAKGESFSVLEKIISELTNLYQRKGEYESTLKQIGDSEENIGKIDSTINDIGKKIYSEEFENKLKKQISKFNVFFSKVSTKIYDEEYVLKHEKEKNKNGDFVYKFSSFNANMSSGKKQGEILCFDLAYTQFAESEKIPSLHFLLNDKKELLHSNQLNEVSSFVSKNGIQLVISMLKDKVPAELIEEKDNVVISLSQEDKLFKIESDK